MELPPVPTTYIVRIASKQRMEEQDEMKYDKMEHDKMKHDKMKHAPEKKEWNKQRLKLRIMQSIPRLIFRLTDM